MAPFDPYHKWLGIPPEQQPPDHYRLLGINQFEGDASVISNAADQRMAFLKSVQTGQHVQFSQDLLNEVAQAKLCLLKADKKLAYDTRLRQQATKTAPPAAPAAVPPPTAPQQQRPLPAPPLPAPRPITSATPRINTSLPHHRRPRQPARRLLSPGRILIFLVLAAGVFSGAYLWLLNTTNDSPTLTAIANVTIAEDASEQTVDLAGITAGGGKSQALRVTVTSDNPELIPALAVAYTSPDSTGSLTFLPGANQFGTATITVTVEDGGLDNNLETPKDNATQRRTFEVTVSGVNDTPHQILLAPQTVQENQPAETFVGTLSIDDVDGVENTFMQYGFNYLYIDAHHDGSVISRIDELQVMNLDSQKIVYFNDFETNSLDGLVLKVQTNGNPPHHADPTLTRIVDGKLELKAPSGGHTAYVVLEDRLPENFEVSFTLYKPNFVGHSQVKFLLDGMPDNLDIATGPSNSEIEHLSFLTKLEGNWAAWASFYHPRKVDLAPGRLHNNFTNRDVPVRFVKNGNRFDFYLDDELRAAKSDLIPRSQNPPVVYELVSGGGDKHNSLFQIDGMNLVTSGPIAHEAGPVASIRMKAPDADGLSVETALQIDITRPINNVPTLDPISDVTIDEDAPAQTVNLTGITAGEGESQVLKVTATSDNPQLIPNPVVTYPAADWMNDGLVAYYPFNGNAKDESGNGNHGEVHGVTLTEDRNGETGKAYAFDGKDDTIEWSDAEADSWFDGKTNLSLSIWINPLVEESSNKKMFFEYGVSIFGLEGRTGPGQDVSFHINGAGAGTTLSTTLDVGQWNHLVLQIDGLNKQLYKNGVLAGNVAFSEAIIGASSFNLGSRLRLRSAPPLTSTHSEFDNLRIYNRALSAREVKTLYDFESTPLDITVSKPKPPAKTTKRKPRLRRKSISAANLTKGLVAYYPFNGNAKDESGNGNDGTVVGATLAADRHGGAGKAYSFDGVDDCIQFASAAFVGDVDFSFSAWIKRSPLNINSHFPTIGIGYTGANRNTKELNFGILSHPTLADTISINVPGYSALRVEADVSITNTWMHLAISKSQTGLTDATTSIYLNGVLKSNYLVGSDSMLNTFPLNNSMVLGKQKGVGGNSFASGSIDDVRIYDRALSADEVAQLYTQTGGTGTLQFTPVADQSGTATITVTVEDGGADNDLATPEDNTTFNRTFDVTVTQNLDQRDHDNPGPVDERLPVPDKESRKTSQALFDDTFKESYDKAAGLEAPQRFDALEALAREIFSLHADEDDPATRFVLLDNAVRIATESGEPDLTTEIIDEISTQFRVDYLSLHVTAVNRWEEQLDENFRGEPLLQKRLQLLDLILPLADRAESTHRYRIAAQLYKLASKLAKTRERQRDLRIRADALGNKAKLHGRMMRLKDELESPDVDSSVEDTATKHLTLGAYLCFELDDWEQGLIHLAASSSGELSQIARLDLDNRGNPENAEAIGDRWWELKLSTRFSKYKALPKARAAHWYALAIGDKKGVARKKLLNRIEEEGFVLDESGLFLETAPSLSSNLNKGLVAYYPFNGNANDESGNGNHGVLNGPVPTADRFDNVNRAFAFDGKEGMRIDVGNHQLSGSFTIAAWVRHYERPEHKWQLIYGTKDDHSINLGVDSDHWFARLHIGGMSTHKDTARDSIPSDQWYHIIATWDQSQAQVYVDGEHKQFSSSRGKLQAPQVAPSEVGGRGGWVLRGMLDDIRIYNRALSAREVNTLYDFESSPRPNTIKRKTRFRRKSTTPPLAVAPSDGRQAKVHQKAWARHLGTRVEISNSIGMKLKFVPPGEFTMGSPESEAGRNDNETQHRVQITKAFYLSVHEVTQAQYERVMGNNPSFFKGDTKPVEQVDWNDALAFCHKLSKQEGVEYRLPTEAEWEYACRAGTSTTYSFGVDESQLRKYAWNKENSGNTTHAAGEKLPNAWGLFDMHGNVWEWCQDWYGAYESLQVISDPKGPASGNTRVFRGGAFVKGSHPTGGAVRAAIRYNFQPVKAFYDLGFRVARSISRTGDKTIRRVGAPFDKPKIPSLRPNLTKGLVAYYPFNGNARDESGNGHDGSLINGGSFTEDQHLAKGAAFSLDGDNHSIQFDGLEPYAPTTTQGMSVSFWATRNVFATVLSQYPGLTPGGNNFFINLETGDNDHYDWNISGNGIGVFRGTPRHYSNDLWQHWFVQIFPGEKGVKVYVNGKLEVNGFNELRGKEVYVKDKPGKFSLNAKTTSTPFYVGHMNGNPQKDGRGAVDDIRIYDRALSAGEVRELYESEKSRP